ncbi:MAG: hypothetical protein R3E98_14850 [Gemmatimonadota bacterium]
MYGRRTPWGAALLLFSLVGASACEPLWVVDLEQPMREIPEEYLRWFGEVAECMGRERDATPERFRVIRWYEGVEIRNPSEGKYALGLWVEPHKITVRTDVADLDYVIKHELVHELLRDGSHEQRFFKQCAGV